MYERPSEENNESVVGIPKRVSDGLTRMSGAYHEDCGEYECQNSDKSVKCTG